MFFKIGALKNYANKIYRDTHVLEFIFLESLLACNFIKKRCSVKKGVLRNFAEFTGKHQCKVFFK